MICPDGQFLMEESEPQKISDELFKLADRLRLIEEFDKSFGSQDLLSASIQEEKEFILRGAKIFPEFEPFELPDYPTEFEKEDLRRLLIDLPHELESNIVQDLEASAEKTLEALFDVERMIESLDFKDVVDVFDPGDIDAKREEEPQPLKVCPARVSLRDELAFDFKFGGEFARCELEDSERIFEDTSDVSYLWSFVIQLAAFAVDISESGILKPDPSEVNLEVLETENDSFESDSSLSHAESQCSASSEMSEPEEIRKTKKRFLPPLKRNLPEKKKLKRKMSLKPEKKVSTLLANVEATQTSDDDDLDVSILKSAEEKEEVFETPANFEARETMVQQVETSPPSQPFDTSRTWQNFEAQTVSQLFQSPKKVQQYRTEALGMTWPNHEAPLPYETPEKLKDFEAAGISQLFQIPEELKHFEAAGMAQSFETPRPWQNFETPGISQLFEIPDKFEHFDFETPTTSSLLDTSKNWQNAPASETQQPFETPETRSGSKTSRMADFERELEEKLKLVSQKSTKNALLKDLHRKDDYNDWLRPTNAPSGKYLYLHFWSKQQCY